MGKWNRFKGGKGWRVANDGTIYADLQAHPESGVDSTYAKDTGGYLYRTPGEPLSMRQLWTDYAPLVTEASAAFDIPIAYILACIGIEATRLKGDRLRFDPRCVRLEPGYLSDSRTPNKVSPGLMQTLLSTAGDMVARCPWLGETRSSLTREDLFVPRYSISLGTAYMRTQMDRFEKAEAGFDPEDPILNVVAAYNAGSVLYTKSNDWHLVTHSTHRIDRFLAWNNDALAVLREAGVAN